MRLDHRLVRRFLAIVTTTVLAAACGLPLEEEAVVLDPDLVQYDLLSTTTSTTSTTEVARPEFRVRFFWHIGDRLIVVEKGRDAPPRPGATLTELVAGPTESDREERPDVQTQLDVTMEPVLLEANEEGVHRIQINRPVEEALSTQQASELVCTVTQFDAIEMVEIIDPEGSVFLLSGDGAVAIPGPARASDFNDCQEDPAPTPETTTPDEDDPTDEESSTTESG